MGAQEVVEHFATSENRIRLMRALREAPASQEELSECCSMSVSTVSRQCDDLTERGWVRTRNSKYKLTGAGAIVLRVYDDSAKTIGRDNHNDLTYLAGAETRVRFLQALRKNSMQEAKLQYGLSDSTIQRHKSGHSERGLINWYGSSCEITESGKQALEKYGKLSKTIEQVEDKNSFLRNIDADCATLPAETLNEAEVVHTTYSHPARPADKFRNRVKEGFDHCWVFASRYTDSDVTAVHQAIDDGATLTVVSPLPSHSVLPTSPTELKYMRRGIKHNAIDWRIYPDELPINMVVFDAEEVMLTITKQPQKGQQNQAMLKSKNDELVTWALDLFDSYYNEAESPLTYLYARLRDAGVNEVLAHIDISSKPAPETG